MVRTRTGPGGWRAWQGTFGGGDGLCNGDAGDHLVFALSYLTQPGAGGADLTGTPLPGVADMAWATPQCSRSKVDAAADYTIAGGPFEGKRLVDALDILSNWRSSHSWPLLSIRLSLTDRAQKVHAKALIAQRLKRLPTIIGKLRRFGHMKLTQMQDIGGCRAILPHVGQVERLDRAFAKAATRRGRHQSECIERYDYIRNPKPDGYRGIHLVYKYHTRLAKYEKHDGLRIEVQLRSRVQHEWATAVETVDLFTKQALKSSIGKEEWKRFFLLTGAVFARDERRPLPPGVPRNRRVLRTELRLLATQLNVNTVLSAWNFVLKEFLPTMVSGARTFLLVLNVDERKLTVRQYTLAMQEQATDNYLAVEKEILKGAVVHAVLVSVRSLRALRQAYPSFYADTRHFLSRLDKEIGGPIHR